MHINNKKIAHTILSLNDFRFRKYIKIDENILLTKTIEELKQIYFDNQKNLDQINKIKFIHKTGRHFKKNYLSDTELKIIISNLINDLLTDKDHGKYLSQLPRLVKSLAKLHINHTHIFNYFSDIAFGNLFTFQTGEDFADLLFAHAYINMENENSNKLLNKLTYLLYKINFRVENLAKIIFSCAIFEYQNKFVVNRIFNKLAELLDENTLKNINIKYLRYILKANFYYKNSFKNKNHLLNNNTILKIFELMDYNTKPNSSSFHLEISKLLKINHIDHTNELFIAGFLVDIAITSKKIVIECDGDKFHYLPNGLLLGKDRLKNNTLALRDWTIYRLRASTWSYILEKETDPDLYLLKMFRMNLPKLTN